ncbi:MAG TPA: TonB-dependent receptor [Woeseiaceae bacterium]|nr:TonB-dependent receptor [Woeseiaceae bacterium]
MHGTTGLALVGLMVLPATGAAETGRASVDEPIDEIVVVAHKTERRLRDVAANVTVLDHDDIERSLAMSVGDAFLYSPGIEAEGAGQRFGDEGLNIRGIGGNRVALLIDGVPLSDQFDVGNFSNATREFLNAGLIQRIEILHGPASALYGSSAIGGVVAAQTPDPADVATDGLGFGLQTAWRGADESWQGTGIAAAAGAHAGVLLGGSLQDGGASDSAALPTQVDARAYRNRSALLKLVADDDSGRSWRAGILHHDAEVDSDLKSMLGSDRFVSTTALRGDDKYQLDLLNLAVDFGAPGGLVDAGMLRASFGRTQVDQRSYDERALAARPVAIDRRFLFEQDVRSLELNLRKDLQLAGGRHGIGAGLEHRRKRTEELRDGSEKGLLDGIVTSTILGETFPLRDFPVSETTEWGAWIEDAMTFGDVTIIAALRVDRYELSVREDAIFARANPAVEPVALTETDLSPKLGVVYRLTDATDVYVQYARGFRAPPFEDANIGLDIPLFNIRAIPNPDLRSETSDGLDVGLRWKGQDSSLHLGIFSTRYNDFIETKVRLGLDPLSGRILFQSRNLSQARIHGLEAGWHSRLPGALRAFTIDGSLYKARGENRDNGEPLNSVGPGQAVLGVSWDGGKRAPEVRLKATLSESWSERDETAGELFKPAGYAVFDLYLTKRLGERTTLRAGLMNLTDTTWWNWSGVRGLAPDDPVLAAIAQPGRSLTIGMNMKWQ